MSSLWTIPIGIGATLALVAGVVFGLEDANTFVSPPEAVAEGFMREVATGRYDRAHAYLEEAWQDRLDPDDLRSFRLELERRIGKIGDVRGQPSLQGRDSARARALLFTETGDSTSIALTLVRSSGVWKIAGLDE